MRFPCRPTPSTRTGAARQADRREEEKREKARRRGLDSLPPGQVPYPVFGDSGWFGSPEAIRSMLAPSSSSLGEGRGAVVPWVLTAPGHPGGSSPTFFVSRLRAR